MSDFNERARIIESSGAPFLPGDAEDEFVDERFDSVDSGEDLQANAAADYEAIAAIDRYEAVGIDDATYALDVEARLRADQALDAAAGGDDAAVLGISAADAGEDTLQTRLQIIRQRQQRLREARAEQEAAAYESAVERGNLTETPAYEEELQENVAVLAAEPLECPADMRLEEFYGLEPTRRIVRAAWMQFMLEFTEQVPSGVATSATALYRERLAAALSSGAPSVPVEWAHMTQFTQNLGQIAADLPYVPILLIPLLENATRDVIVGYIDRNYAAPRFGLRFTGYVETISLRRLRVRHLNTLVRVRGVVTQQRPPLRRLVAGAFQCSVCGQTLRGGHRVDIAAHGAVSFCDDPECRGAKRRGLVRVVEGTGVYENVVRVRIQEPPGDVSPGRLPASAEVEISGQAAASSGTELCKPGSGVIVLGIQSIADAEAASMRTGLPVFQTIIKANSVESDGAAEAQALTQDEERRLTALGSQPGIIDRILASVAPSIAGTEHVKRAVALALFGGTAKPTDEHYVRGDVNVLLVGDPSTAKSQILKYASQTAPRAVYTSGRGASAVGLTAAVVRDPVTGEFTLEGGALVLADRGTCILDEFEKMSERDRTSIHEALEQQTISISKAGIVATLPARCSVIAAANPVKGCYDPALTFAQNVDLGDPIISRFDVICVVRDIVDPITDGQTADHVVANHTHAHPALAVRKRFVDELAMSEAITAAANAGDPSAGALAALGSMSGLERDWHIAEKMLDRPIPQSILRKYIAFAREKVTPLLPADIARSERIPEVYTRLRREAARTNSVPITLRATNSIVRLGEAFARMRLSNAVSGDDVDRAVRVVVQSFCETQHRGTRERLERSLVDLIVGQAERAQLLRSVLHALVRDRYALETRIAQNAVVETVSVPRADFVRAAGERGQSEHAALAYLQDRRAAGDFQLSDEGMIVFSCE